MITKKNDIKIISFFVLIAVIGFIITGTKKKGAIVVIEKNNEVIGRYSLYEDRVIEIPGGNTCEIKNGKVLMISATCKDKICVHHKAISKEGESIVCLPNKVIIKIEGGDKNIYDGVTN